MNPAEAAVGHYRDDVAVSKLGQQMRDDFVSAGKRKCRFVLRSNRLNQLIGIQGPALLRNFLTVENARDHDVVSRRKGIGIFILENCQPRRPRAWFKYRDQPAIWIAVAQPAQSFAHRGGMVGEVVNYRDSAFLTANLRTPANILEASQRIADCLARNPPGVGSNDHCQTIEQIEVADQRRLKLSPFLAFAVTVNALSSPEKSVSDIRHLASTRGAKSFDLSE